MDHSLGARQYDTSIKNDLTLKIVEPGNYILSFTQLIYEPERFLQPVRIESHSIFSSNPSKPSPENGNETFLGDIEVYRIDIKPGEVVYLGEFVFTAFAPKWINRQDELDALMAKMKHVSVKPVFRPPVIRDR